MKTSRFALVIVLIFSLQLWACVPTKPVNSATAEQTGSQSSRANAVPSPAQTTAVVKSKKANLRNKPSKSALVVGQVSRDEQLTLVAQAPQGPWYNVRTANGSVGWVHGNVIALNRATSQITPALVQKSPERSIPITSGRSYVTVDGIRVPSPVFTPRQPAGATARCRDGSYSFSQHRRGTCSHHGGVAEWL